MTEKYLTNGLEYAVYDKILDGATLIAVFKKSEDAERYKKFLQSQNKNHSYYTKKIG